METMTRENAAQIFKQELYLYTEYQRLIRQKKEYKQEQIEARVDIHAVTISDGGTSSALTQDEKLAVYCFDIQEIDYAIQVLTEMIDWINETIKRIDPAVRLYTIYHYMLRKSIDQIAGMADIHPVICRTQISSALESVLTDERINEYNKAKKLLNSAISTNKLETLKHKKT